MNKERKYKYHAPESSEETLEAIYEELSCRAKNDGFKRDETIRDVVASINSLIKEYRSSLKERKERELFVEDVSHGACGISGIALTFYASQAAQKWEWVNESLVFYLGLTLSLIFLAVSLERMSFIKNIWRYGFVKFLASVIFGGALIYCNSKSSGIINEIFAVDASAFIYSQSILTGLLLFKIIGPVFWLVLVSCAVHGLVIWAQVKNNDLRVKPIVFLACSLIVSGYSLNVVSNFLSDEEIKLKAYKLAHYLDFGDKIYCVDETDFRKDVVGVFLDSSQRRYLLDYSLNEEEFPKEFIHERAEESDIRIPDKFRVGICG